MSYLYSVQGIARRVITRTVCTWDCDVLLVLQGVNKDSLYRTVLSYLYCKVCYNKSVHDSLYLYCNETVHEMSYLYCKVCYNKDSLYMRLRCLTCIARCVITRTVCTWDCDVLLVLQGLMSYLYCKDSYNKTVCTWDCDVLLVLQGML